MHRRTRWASICKAPTHQFGVSRSSCGSDPEGNLFEVLPVSPEALVTVASMFAARQGQIVDSARSNYRPRVADGQP
ncbi:MAG: hypothetical protein B7Y43_03660 [Sphingomonas sp. 28-62-20]|nr:MAG: hypothetical protein B7Y43_03660 [Sphingomonas sp. 28-62-20]